MSENEHRCPTPHVMMMVEKGKRGDKIVEFVGL